MGSHEPLSVHDEISMGHVCYCELVSTAVMSCVEDSISHFCLFHDVLSALERVK